MSEQFLDRPDMIGKSCRHRWRPLLPATLPIVYLQPQAFVWSGKVVDQILPNTGGSEHIVVFGKPQSLAYQPPIHQPRCQVCALNVSGMFLQFSANLLRLSIDHARFGPNDPTIPPLFDHLQVLPPRPRLLSRRCTARSWLPGRYLTVDFHQCLPMSPQPIRGQGRGIITTAPFFQHSEGLL